MGRVKGNEDSEGNHIDREEFGRRLRMARQESKITSEQLANACGVNAVFIRQIESGTRLPSLAVFVKICDNLQISPAFLLGNEVKIEVTECGWEELAKIQCDMTPDSQKIVKEVLESLIKNLAEADKKKNW